MKLIKQIGNALSLVERSLLVVLLLVMVVLSFLQVVLRNAFSLGLLWADPLLRIIVMWAGFLGAVLATEQEKHFGIDFLNRFFSPRVLHSVKTLVGIFATVIAFLLARGALQFLFEGIGDQERGVFDVPKRIYFAIIPTAFGLIALHFFLHVVRHIRGVFGDTADVDESQSSQPT